MNITTSQGPSSKNQTSEDHGHDSNQAARQPTADQVIAAEGEPVESMISEDATSSNNS